jgi:seryl-tRNA(Sec) selenium transferase
MTGDDPEKMASLPDTTRMNNEVIVQRSLRFEEDCALKQTGARIVEICGGGSQGIAALERAIRPRTAAIFMTSGTGPEAISLTRVIPIARQHGVPVIVDAAEGVPPAENLWKFTRQVGADLAIFSGGKGLRGPQNSGLVVGAKRLVEAMKMQASPHCYIGRPMKVGKEEMVGLYIAVECLLSAGGQDRLAVYEKRRLHIEGRLRHLHFLRFEHERSSLGIKWDEAARAITAKQVAEQMRSGNPPIECGCWKALRINVESLQDGEEEIVAARVAQIMSS